MKYWLNLLFYGSLIFSISPITAMSEKSSQQTSLKDAVRSFTSKVNSFVDSFDKKDLIIDQKQFNAHMLHIIQNNQIEALQKLEKNFNSVMPQVKLMPRESRSGPSVLSLLYLSEKDISFYVIANSKKSAPSN